MSATLCLKHPWLNNITEKAKSSNVVLKSQVLLKKYMARRMWKVKHREHNDLTLSLHCLKIPNACFLPSFLVHPHPPVSFVQKNYIAIAAANRFKKIGSSGSLTALGI